MRKSIILRHRNFNKQKTGQAKRAVILVGILALSLVLLAGCRQRPKEVELEKKELVPLEEMIPLEPRVEETPMVAEAPLGVTPIAPVAVAGRININTATQVQLESIPGIGPSKAQAIIAGRPYASIEEITKVKGIGPKTYGKFKDSITVSGAAAPAPTAAQAPTAAPTVTAPAKPTAGTININTATQAQLESLSGIGPAKAQLIIAGRPYASIAEITKVKGIGPKTYENLKNLITVN